MISKFGIFEGRGWDVRPEHPLNVDSLTIAFLTDFLYKPGEMLNGTLDKLIADGIFLEKLAKKFEMTCSEDFCTENPTEKPTEVPPVEIGNITVSRSEWGASPPKSKLKNLAQPVKRIVVTDTTYLTEGGENCESQV